MPIESDAFYNMLGIAMRAGALTLGEDGVRKAIAAQQAALVLVDDGASANTKKRFTDACAYYGAPLWWTQPGRLGAAIGRPGRMSAAVTPGTLGDKLRALADKEEERLAALTGKKQMTERN